MARDHPSFSKLSTFYADESDNKQFYAIACINIPTATFKAGGSSVEWQSYYDSTVTWRRELKAAFNVPINKELKGSKIATGRNFYDGGRGRIHGRRAFQLYSFALEALHFLPDASVFSVISERGYQLFGHTRLEATLYALFQRMQSQCRAKDQVSLIFFDEGHMEYRRMFRRACTHLPTGSMQGEWSEGAATKNIPLDRAIKDVNFKDSKQSPFVQIADLIAYATILKLKAETGTLTERERDLGFGSIFDHIPRPILNVMVDLKKRDGIKRLRK